MTNICDYGCNQLATHQFKNGRWCCSNVTSSCPAMKKINSGSIDYREVDYTRLQALYDSGLSWAKVAKHENISISYINNNKSKLVSRSRSGARLLLAPCTQETRNKLRQSAKLRGLGGVTNGGGTGHKGYYKGFWCDSSWELAYIIYCLDHNITIVRNTKSFKYIFDGIEYNYFPDFIVNDTFIEIKGYASLQWKAKLDYFPDAITVLYRKDIQQYLKYARETYGRDFIRLYQNGE